MLITIFLTASVLYMAGCYGLGLFLGWCLFCKPVGGGAVDRDHGEDPAQSNARLRRSDAHGQLPVRRAA